MNVNIKYTDETHAVLTVEVEKADYQENLEKNLRHYRQRVSMPGFRAGKVPMSIIQRKYGVAFKVEEINQLVGKSIYDYIREEKIAALGEPMQVASQEELDFEKEDNFTFNFDLAIAPKIEVKLTKKNKVDYYNITVTEEDIDSEVARIRDQFGKHVDVDEYKDKDLVYGHLIQLENGEAKDGGIDKENAMIMPSIYKDEDEKKKFEGAKKNSAIRFFPHKATDGNAYELSNLLGVDKKELDLYKEAEFEFQIDSIKRFEQAELNDEFFSMNFDGNADVKDEASLRAWIKTSLESQLEKESLYRFSQDLKKYLIEKAGKPEYPVDLLAKWLKSKKEEEEMKKKEEDRQPVEDPDIEAMLPDLTYSILRDKMLADYEIKPEEDEIKETIVRITRARMAQYGMQNIPDEMMDQFVQKTLANREEVERYATLVADEKLAAKVKEVVTLNEKTLTQKEYSEMLQKENEQA
ncbi:trigger factor [Falsiporphyromonas endometrii]|uniref:Trigger factor n=1 Tax=Falsiporphyromonas endometrii TaxID=1387297 RepID=A0ABV9K816_9PORP